MMRTFVFQCFDMGHSFGESTQKAVTPLPFHISHVGCRKDEAQCFPAG